MTPIRQAERAELDALARWAAQQLKRLDTYISHGEVTSGRSPDGVHWAEDLAGVLAGDFAACLDSGGCVLVASAGAGAGAAVEGLCAIHLEEAAGGRIATIEDLLVADTRRGDGLGAALLAAAEAECARMGAQHILLESGIGNAGAHRFFERQGYAVVSKVFMKRG
jgi:GNAT superfamily N-acetyltransferase